MIYFIIHNDYQFFNFVEVAKACPDEQFSLIVIPHKLTVDLDCDRVTNVYYFDKLYSNHFAAVRQFRGFHRREHLSNKLVRGDKLIIFTEYELVNYKVVEIFAKMSLDVYLLEDGVGTYHPMVQTESQSMSLRNYLKIIFVRFFLGVKTSRILKFNGAIMFFFPNRFFKAILLFEDIPIRRKVNTVILARLPHEHRSKVLNVNSILMLDQPLADDRIVSRLTHENLTIFVLKKFLINFEIVYFKHHPRQTDFFRQRILLLIKEENLNVKILDADVPFEKIVDGEDSKFLASYFSTPLFDWKKFGITPVFLYQLIEDASFSVSKKALDEITISLGIAKAQNLDEITPTFNPVTLVENSPPRITMQRLLKSSEAGSPQSEIT